MHRIRSVGVRTGIAGGLVFLVHVLIPYSGSYPFIWPALTGAAAFWIATNDGAPRRIPRGMLTTLVSGIIVGLIGFVGSTLWVFALSLPAMRPITESLGIGGQVVVTISAVFALAAIGAVAVGAALIGGAVMIPVRLLTRRSRTSAPLAR